MIAFIPGKVGTAITVLQVMATATSYYNEVQPTTRAPYSKFVSSEGTNQKEKMVGSRTGMMIIYSPALLASISLSLFSIVPYSLGNYLCTIHFLKRVLEVLFLHRYSGVVGLSISSCIGFYYALVSVLVACIATPEPSPNVMYAGVSLFTIGLVGNFYHHFLLANLRHGNDSVAKPGEKQYFVPRGGLFKYVAAPHYLFELIGWLGMGIACHHANALLIFTSMSSYLGGRSVAQNKWNMEKFPIEWPSTQKNMIPFIF